MIFITLYFYRPLEHAPAFHIGFVRLVLSSYAMEKKLRQLIISQHFCGGRSLSPSCHQYP